MLTKISTLCQKQLVNGSYKGQLKNGKADGIGQVEWKDEVTRNMLTYTGQFKDDCKHGFGKQQLSTQEYYIGYQQNNEYFGFGLVIKNNVIQKFMKTIENNVVIDLKKQFQEQQQDLIRKNFEIQQNEIQTYYNNISIIDNLFQSGEQKTEYLENKLQKIEQNTLKIEFDLMEQFRQRYETDLINKQLQELQFVEIKEQTYKYVGQMSGMMKNGVGRINFDSGAVLIQYSVDQCYTFGSIQFKTGNKLTGFLDNKQQDQFAIATDIKNKILNIGFQKNAQITVQFDKYFTSEQTIQLNQQFQNTYQQVVNVFNNIQNTSQLYGTPKERLNYIQTSKVNMNQLITELKAETDKFIQIYYQQVKLSQQIQSIKVNQVQFQNGTYTGQFCNEIMCGIGKFVFDSSNFYVGQFDGLQNGFGAVYYTDGNIKIGYLKNMKMHGFCMKLQQDQLTEFGIYYHSQLIINITDVIDKNQSNQYKDKFLEIQSNIEKYYNNIKQVNFQKQVDKQTVDKLNQEKLYIYDQIQNNLQQLKQKFSEMHGTFKANTKILQLQLCEQQQPNYIYNGQLNFNQKIGLGKATTNENNWFLGWWDGDQKNGFGQLRLQKGERIQGFFFKNQLCGVFIEYKANGQLNNVSCNVDGKIIDDLNLKKDQQKEIQQKYQSYYEAMETHFMQLQDKLNNIRQIQDKNEKLQQIQLLQLYQQKLYFKQLKLIKQDFFTGYFYDNIMISLTKAHKFKQPKDNQLQVQQIETRYINQINELQKQKQAKIEDFNRSQYIIKTKNQEIEKLQQQIQELAAENKNLKQINGDIEKEKTLLNYQLISSKINENAEKTNSDDQTLKIDEKHESNCDDAKSENDKQKTDDETSKKDNKSDSE